MFYGNAILTIFLAFSGVGGAGDGADSVHTEIIDTLTVLQAEQLLAERNAELRLSRLACTEAEANARQARRWENPEVSGIYNLYNPLNSRWLDPGNDGEVDISVSQPLPIGRSHRIGRSDAELRASQADYDWTAFSLSMQMKRQLCELWAVQRRAALIGGELESVERILDAYRRNPQAVSLVEVRRLETLRLGLLSEQLERQATVAECKTALAVMLGLEETGFGIGELDLNDEPAPSDSILEQSALLRYHASLCEAADAEIRLQKALATSGPWGPVSRCLSSTAIAALSAVLRWSATGGRRCLRRPSASIVSSWPLPQNVWRNAAVWWRNPIASPSGTLRVWNGNTLPTTSRCSN